MMIILALTFILTTLLLVARVIGTRTNVPSKRVKQLEADGLIAVILPIINSEK